MARPKSTIISHLHQVEKLKRLYIRHAQKFGKINEQRYLGVLDGLDLAMELTQSIRTFEKDLETR